MDNNRSESAPDDAFYGDADPELVAKAEGDYEYLHRLIAVDTARRRLEEEPSEGGRELLQQMKQELIQYEIDNGKLPPHEEA